MKQKPKKVLLRELKTGHIFMIDDNYSFWYLVLKTEEKENGYNHFLCLQEDGRITKRIINRNILLILLNRDE